MRQGEREFVQHLIVNTPLTRSVMACVLSFTCTPHVHPLTKQTIPAFSFPAEAGPHLPTPEGWKAELAWVAGYISK